MQTRELYVDGHTPDEGLFSSVSENARPAALRCV